jgi:4-hydroxy-3-polyprenylbenzoate decarboxylase
VEVLFVKFRPFLKYLSEEKELQEVKETVSPVLQAGALAAKNLELDGPALHFKNIEGHPGASLVSGIYASPSDLYPKRRRAWIRTYLSMERDPEEMKYEELQEHLFDAQEQGGIKPLEVSSGPCKENIQTGDQVNVTDFPFPIIHEQDGGQYGTQHVIIVEDPEKGVISWSDERFMVLSRDKLVVKMEPDSRLYEIYQKYVKINKPMPFVIATGVDSGIPLATAVFMERVGLGGLKQEVPAPDVAGYLVGEPVELVKAETCNLKLPASAELVLEGEVVPGEAALEGPYPNFYRIEGKTEQPVFKVKAITHRNDPIIPFDVTGIKGSDSMTLRSLAHSFKIYRILNGWWWGTKIARWAYCPVSFRLGMMIVSVNALYPGFEFHFSRIIYAYSHWFDKVMLVDNSLGAEELARVMQDFIQKASPVHAFHFSKDDCAPISKAAKYPNDGKTTGRLHVNACLDPTWPPELIPTRVSFETTWPKDIQEKVIANWGKMGFVNKPKRCLINY